MGVVIGSPQELANVNMEYISYDLATIYSVRNTNQFYIAVPRKFIIKIFLRYCAEFFIYCLFSFNILLYPLIPWWTLELLKFYNFAKFSEYVNVSPKKLIGFMFVVIVIEIFISFHIRNFIFTLFN